MVAGDPSKPLMVFVHGYPECWFSWRHQIKFFKKVQHILHSSPQHHYNSANLQPPASFTLIFYDKIIYFCNSLFLLNLKIIASFGGQTMMDPMKALNRDKVF